jgi:hypothetical protein
MVLRLCPAAHLMRLDIGASFKGDFVLCNPNINRLCMAIVQTVDRVQQAKPCCGISPRINCIQAEYGLR